MWDEHLTGRVNRELDTDDRLDDQNYHMIMVMINLTMMIIVLTTMMITLMITSSMLCISWTVSMLFAFKCFRKALKDHLCPYKRHL